MGIDEETKQFAQKITEYTIGKFNKKIDGYFEAGNLNFKPFEITGPKAIEIHKYLIKIQDENKG